MVHSSRIYARRRLAALIIVVFATLVVLAVVLPAQASNTRVEIPTTTVTVQQDDSLWTIARTHSNGARTDHVVDLIMELNGLEGSAIRPGQELKIPAR